MKYIIVAILLAILLASAWVMTAVIKTISHQKIVDQQIEQRQQEQMVLMSRLSACDGLDSYKAIKACLDDVERTTRE